MLPSRSYITYNIEYGIGIVISKKWRRPSGSEEKVDPATETRKERQNHTHKITQPSKRIALQIDSPPKKMSCTLPRKKASQDRETEKRRLIDRRRRQ